MRVLFRRADYFLGRSPRPVQDARPASMSPYPSPPSSPTFEMGSMGRGESTYVSNPLVKVCLPLLLFLSLWPGAFRNQQLRCEVLVLLPQHLHAPKL